MTNFSDELRGAEGEWCRVSGRRAIIRAVHDDGQKATVQFEDDESCDIYGYRSIQLEDDEDTANRKKAQHG